MRKILAFLLALTLFSGLAVSQNSVKLEVNKVKVEPVPLQTSEYADIWVEVTNTGGIDTDDAKLELVENYPFSVDPDERTQWDLGRLVPGEEYMIHLQVRVDDNAVQGENNLKFRTTAGDVSVTHDVPVEVRSDNDILSISRVDFPENVAPGSSSEMDIELKNLADGQLKNIESELDLADVPVATSGTTSRVITKINSGGTKKASFSLNVDESAENGVYKIPLTLEYENEAGNTFTRETTTGVVVGGAPKLKAGLNSVEDRLTPGSTGTVTFRLVNKGRGSADFVELGIPESSDYEILSPNSVYMGDMDPDDYQTAEFDLHVSGNVSDLPMPVEITYQSASGEESVTQQVEVPVYTSQELQSYGLAGGGGNILPIVIILLLVGGGVYYWRRRKRSRD